MIKIDWQRYHELEKRDYNTLTEEEKDFIRYMYHVEEFKTGLDGDRLNEPENEDENYDD